MAGQETVAAPSGTSVYAKPRTVTDLAKLLDVMAGYERRLSAWIATAFEVQYTHVPDALSGNVAEAFKESNMGGVEVRIRVAVGR